MKIKVGNYHSVIYTHTGYIHTRRLKCCILGQEPGPRFIKVTMVTVPSNGNLHGILDLDWPLCINTMVVTKGRPS